MGLDGPKLNPWAPNSIVSALAATLGQRVTMRPDKARLNPWTPNSAVSAWLWLARHANESHHQNKIRKGRAP
jgi:hypothetical protein